MKLAESKMVALALATAMALAIHVGLEGVDVNIEHDKAFDFKSARTWAWNPKGAGDVIVAECTDPLAAIDIPNLLNQTGDTLVEKATTDGVLTFRIRKK